MPKMTFSTWYGGSGGGGGGRGGGDGRGRGVQVRVSGRTCQRLRAGDVLGAH